MSVIDLTTVCWGNMRACRHAYISHCVHHRVRAFTGNIVSTIRNNNLLSLRGKVSQARL